MSVLVSFRWPVELVARVDELARAEGRSRSNMALQLVEQALMNEGGVPRASVEKLMSEDPVVATASGPKPLSRAVPSLRDTWSR